MAEPKKVEKPNNQFSLDGIPPYLAKTLSEDVSKGLQPPDYTPWDVASMIFNPQSMMTGGLKRVGSKVMSSFAKESGDEVPKSIIKLVSKQANIPSEKVPLETDIFQIADPLFDISKWIGDVGKKFKEGTPWYETLFSIDKRKQILDGISKEYGDVIAKRTERLLSKTLKENPHLANKPTLALTYAWKKAKQTIPRDPLENIIKVSGSTAMARGKKISQPTKELIEGGFFNEPSGMKVLHHGSGKASADTRAIFKQRKVSWVDEYDPNFSPHRDMLGKADYDRVVSNYVLNVLPPKERANAIRDIGSSLSPQGKGLITVRGKGDKIIGTPEVGGLITKKGTYQKTFSPNELREELGQYFDDVKIIKGTDKSKMVTAQVGKWKVPNPK